MQSQGLTEEQKANIAECAPDATITHAAIARTVGCRPDQVGDYLKEIVAPKRAAGKRLTSEQKALITKYTGEGKKPDEIGPLVKLSPTTVSNYLASVARKKRRTSKED